MWIIDFLPNSLIDWLVNTMLVIGVLGTIAESFLKVAPFLIQYRIAIKYGSLLLLVAGIYFKGMHYADIAWQEKVHQAEEKVKIAEAKSQQTNTIIEEKVVEKIKVVTQQVVKNHNIIKKQKEYINAECKIPDVAFDIYNSAVRNGSND